MKRLIRMKCFVLLLIGLYIVINSTEKVNALKLKSMDAGSSEEEDELINSISNQNLSKEDIKKYKDEDKAFEGQSCEDIKKLGQQKAFCEKKYLLAEGENKTVECMKTFCDICCAGEDTCKTNCSKAHSMFADHDPEEMLISVCSYSSMGPSFEGFCKSMITDNDMSEYDQCITNFCFDCCSNELKINDFNDPEINKCLKICKSHNKSDKNIDKAVPGTPQADKKIELKNKTEEKNAHNTLDSKKGKVNVNHKESLQNRSKVKVLIDFSHLGKKTVEEKDVTNEIEEKSDLIEEEKKNSANTKDSLDKLLDKIDQEDEKEQTKQNLSKKIQNDKKNLTNEVKNKPEKVKEKNVHSVNKNSLELKIDNILLTTEERKNKNMKICENLILSFANIKHFGKNVFKHCENNYEVDLFETVDGCLSNLCNECCDFLEKEKEIKHCINQCTSKKILTTKLKEEESKPKETFDEKLSESINFLQKEKTKDLDRISQELEVDILSNKNISNTKSEQDILPIQNIKPLNLSPSGINSAKDYNSVNFDLIKSLCNTKYFKDCHEIICKDFCEESSNLIIKNCFKSCTNHMTSLLNKNGMFDYILKRHGYYKAKFEVLFERKNKTNQLRESLSPSRDRESQIMQKKKKIENLKKELYTEEKILLELYKNNKS